MTSTEVALATTTLSSAASSITFSSIPGTYTDLRLVIVTKGSGSLPAARMRVNSSSSSVYSYRTIQGQGSSIESTRDGGLDHVPFATSFYKTEWQMITMDIFNYTAAINRTMLFRAAQDQNGSGSSGAIVALFADTTAVTSLLLYANWSFDPTATFDTGTTATLYGIL